MKTFSRNAGIKPAGTRKLLVLDTAFSLEAIIKRGLQESVTCRDLDGYFEHVWSVHPFSTLVTTPGWTKKFGKPEFHQLNEKHTFIDGKMGRFSFLSWIFPLNFLIGQFLLILQLRRLIRKEKITVIRAGDILYLGLLGWLLARLCRVPLLVRVGGNNDKVFETTGQPIQKRLFFSRTVEKKVERFVLKRADLVAGANQDNLKFAIANGAHPEYSTIFRYGNLIHKLHFSDPDSRTGEPFLSDLRLRKNGFLMYIGRLEKVKHPDDVVRVLAYVRSRGFDVKALMVGDGRMLEDLQQLSRGLGVEDSVIFCGNRPQELLAQVIPSAAVVVSPHTGRALSEAALGGVPIVAYDIDWQSEMIETGVTGELVPHADWEKMADAVCKFLSNRNYAEQMAAGARARAMKMMWHETLDQHERDQYEILFARFYRNRMPGLFAVT